MFRFETFNREKIITAPDRIKIFNRALSGPRSTCSPRFLMIRDFKREEERRGRDCTAFLSGGKRRGKQREGEKNMMGSINCSRWISKDILARHVKGNSPGRSFSPLNIVNVHCPGTYFATCFLHGRHKFTRLNRKAPRNNTTRPPRSIQSYVTFEITVEKRKASKEYQLGFGIIPRNKESRCSIRGMEYQRRAALSSRSATKVAYKLSMHTCGKV